VTITTVTIGRDRLGEVAGIHRRAFPEGALTALGPEAVRRYYEWQLCGPHDVVFLGAIDATAGLVGFCVGGVFRGALSGYLRANRLHLLRTVAARPWIVGQAVVRERGARAIVVLAHTRHPRSSPPSPARQTFGVLAVAVDPDHRRRGIGRCLLTAIEAAARERGFHRMALTIDPANLGAARFYEASGWTASGPAERPTAAMEKRIGGEA